MHRGFSTLELLIAMALMVVTLSAVIEVSFGNQDMLIAGEMNDEGLRMAQSLLEQEQALSRKDFKLVNPIAAVTDGIYQKSVAVEPWPGDPYTTKRVTSRVNWSDVRHITRGVALTTLVTNFEDAVGVDTCSSVLTGDWTLPAVSSPAFTITNLAGVTGRYPISDMDAYQNRLYVAVASTTGNSDKTFFIFNLSSGIPAYISGSGIDTSGNTSTKGPNAIAVVAEVIAGKTYAFLANGVSPDWSNPNSCGVASASCSQVEVVDVTNPAAPSIVKYFKFATSTYSIPNVLPYVNGNGGQAVGKAIYYKDRYIFLGLSKTGSGPEFHVIDVHDPLSPRSAGSYTVGRSVNAIYVRGNFAYLATDDNAAGNNNVLTILNLSDPTNPQKVWPNSISSSLGIGSAVTAVGDDLYFATTYNNPAPPEFFVFDNPRPTITAPIQKAGVSLGGTLSVSDVLIRDYLAYLLTSSNTLQILHTGTGAQYAPPITLSGPGSAMDCEGNYLYVGSSDAAGSIMSITGS